MNDTLYRWTFNFHKVVRQQNSGAVEDFILLYSAVCLWIQKWKNYWNRSTFAKVKVARFFMAHGVYVSPSYGPASSDVNKFNLKTKTKTVFLFLRRLETKTYHPVTNWNN